MKGNSSKKCVILTISGFEEVAAVKFKYRLKQNLFEKLTIKPITERVDMPIDYSKWDNIDTSDEDENSSSVGESFKKLTVKSSNLNDKQQKTIFRPLDSNTCTSTNETRDKRIKKLDYDMKHSRKRGDDLSTKM